MVTRFQQSGFGPSDVPRGHQKAPEKKTGVKRAATIEEIGRGFVAKCRSTLGKKNSDESIK